MEAYPTAMLRRSGVHLALVGILLIGCSRSSSTVRDCATQAAAIGEQLRAHAEPPSPLPPLTGETPISALGRVPEHFGSIIELTAEGVRFDAQPIETLDDFSSRYQTSLTTAGASGTKRVVYVHAHPRVPFGKLTELVGVLSDQPEVGLIVVPRQAPPDPFAGAPEPVRMAIDEIRSKTPPHLRTGRVADALTKAIGSCHPLASMFGAAAAMDANRQMQHLITETPKRVEACDCKLSDLEMFRYVLLLSLTNGSTYRYVALRRAGEGHVVNVPRAATVGDMLASAERDHIAANSPLVLRLLE